MGRTRSSSALNFSLAAWRERIATDTELAQALFRLPVGLACSIFVYAGYPDLSVPLYAIMLDFTPWFTGYFYSSAFVLVALVSRFPGHFRWRRLYALTMDLAGVVVCLCFDGERVLPIFAGMIWIVVGFGMRFGTRWLLIAISLSLVSLGVVTAVHPYWQAHPSLVVMMAATAVIAPGYAFFIYARLRQAHLETARANLEKSRFLAQASHDLRHPLRAIGLLVPQLRKAPLNPAQIEVTRRIEDAVHNAGDLLQRFLDISIIEAGRLEARRVSFGLNALFQELVDQNRPAAEHVGSSLHFVPTQRWVYADRTFIRTMLQNLISNAIRHAPGTRVLIGCRQQSRTGGNRLAIQVIDCGPGMPEPISKGWKTSARELGPNGKSGDGGTGIGLSIVWRLARLSGLDVGVVAQAGKGTVVSIQGLEPVEAPIVRVSSPLAGLRVMLATDTRELAEKYAEMLKRWHCQPMFPVETDAVSNHEIAIADLSETDALMACYSRSDRPMLVLTSQPGEPLRHLLTGQQVIIASKPITPAELRSLLLALKAKVAAQTP